MSDWPSGVGMSSPDEMVEKSLGDVGGKAFRHHRAWPGDQSSHQLAHPAAEIIVPPPTPLKFMIDTSESMTSIG